MTRWKWLPTVALCGVLSVTLSAQKRTWQTGHWRDSTITTTTDGAVGIPIGAMMFSFPSTGTTQIVTIESADGLLYVATRKLGRPWPVVVNDPVLFAIDRDRLYAKAADSNKEFWFDIVKRVRLPQ